MIAEKRRLFFAYLHGGDALSLAHTLQQKQNRLLLCRILFHLVPGQRLNLLEQLHIILSDKGQ